MKKMILSLIFLTSILCADVPFVFTKDEIAVTYNGFFILDGDEMVPATNLIYIGNGKYIRNNMRNGFCYKCTWPKDDKRNCMNKKCVEHVPN